MLSNWVKLIKKVSKLFFLEIQRALRASIFSLKFMLLFQKIGQNFLSVNLRLLTFFRFLLAVLVVFSLVFAKQSFASVFSSYCYNLYNNIRWILEVFYEEHDLFPL